MPSSNLPVGASKDALDDALEARIDAEEAKKRPRRIFSIFSAVGTFVFGMATWGLTLLPEMRWGGFILGSTLSLSFAWLTWRWSRGLPPLRSMGRLPERAGDGE
jgi:hypothetical protein